jgi:hypothetical protein
MATVRVYSAVAKTATHPSGRSYTLTAGGILDIPEAELDEMDWRGQGLVLLGAPVSNAARSGSTSDRPTYQSARPPRLGESYIDTTLSYVVYFAGPAGSAAGTWVSIAGSTV